MSDFTKTTQNLDTALAAERIENEHLLFEALQELLPDILFRLDLQTNVMRSYGRGCAKNFLPERLENFPESVALQLHPDDMETLRGAVEGMKQGLIAPCFIRMDVADGKARWHRHEYVLRYDAAGTPTEAIGRVIDVHDQKQMEERIHLDSLTGCLRKDSFEAVSKSYLAAVSANNHALFIIDIDNFKAINDNLGHHFGDSVLREMGERLQKVFRGSDYIGRVGGDEFMVFARNVGDPSVLMQKAQEVMTAMDITYSSETHAYRVTGSIGFACYPQDGTTFEALYQNADAALYGVKHRGKNGFLRYDPSLSKGTMENTTPFDVAKRTLSQHFDDEVLSTTFDLLFHSRDIKISMNAVLRELGTKFAASRCYIFECGKTAPNTYDNTYEWCAQGIAPEIDNLQGLSGEVIGTFVDCRNDAGVFYCNDLSTLEEPEARELMAQQGIQSFLHIYLMAGDKLLYMLGFDDCVAPRIWSPIEVGTLMYVSKIIAQFLDYKNALESAQYAAQEQLSVLDAFHSMAYIIDIQRYRVLYFNEATKKALPELQLGEPCYKSLRGLDSACPNCPVNALQEENTSQANCVIFNEPLQKDMLVTATRLANYAGVNCAFVSASDVTEIIKPEIRART